MVADVASAAVLADEGVTWVLEKPVPFSSYRFTRLLSGSAEAIALEVPSARRTKAYAEVRSVSSKSAGWLPPRKARTWLP